MFQEKCYRISNVINLRKKSEIEEKKEGDKKEYCILLINMTLFF